jgi:hypothetical protein
VQTPTKYETVLNLKTAKALGLIVRVCSEAVFQALIHLKTS